jgi:precorrin-6Y C5,15-methyltransferase (decarboxylating)
MLPANHTWIDVKVPLGNVFEQYRAYSIVVVFASGDPLFFGFASTIKRLMPSSDIALYPYFSSLQQLAHRLLMPYHDMQIVSLTGRTWDMLDTALIQGYSKVGVLTDREKTPSAAAERMLYYGYDRYKMFVGECLGNKDADKVSEHELKDVVGKSFAFPNSIILAKTCARQRPFGIPDGELHLLNGRSKMVTKMPIRLLALSMLDLRDKKVFWDIGFCTGSVSVEAKLQFPQLQAYAFEQRIEGSELIDKNARKFGTPGITAIIGDFVQLPVGAIPAPDAVFIGGHDGKLHEVVAKVANVISENGTVVFNSVSEESKAQFTNAASSNGLQMQQVTAIKVDGHNTISVMKAVKVK